MNAFQKYLSAACSRGLVLTLLFLAVETNSHAWIPKGAFQFQLQEARQLTEERKLPEAIVTLKSLLAGNPGHPDTLLLLSRVLTMTGRREEALSLLNNASSSSPALRELFKRRARVLSRLFLSQEAFRNHQEGMNYLLAGKLRDSRESFERALSLEPNQVEVLTHLGEALILLGDFDSASERLRLAKRLNPYEPEIQLWLGRALHQRGELYEAMALLKGAQEAMDKSELASLWLAEAYESAGQPDEAARILESKVARQPFQLQNLLALVRLQSSRDPEAARRTFELFQSRLPKYQANKDSAGEGELGFNVVSTEMLQKQAREWASHLDGENDDLHRAAN